MRCADATNHDSVADLSPCEGIVSSEQQGVVVWVLYPLEHWMESLLDLWESSSRPLDRARASSSWTSAAWSQMTWVW